VKPDQRDRILAAIDKASDKLNGIDLETSMATASRMFARLAELTAQLQTREQIVEIFNSSPDVSFKDEMLIRTACRYAPELFRIGGTALADIAKKEFPRAPGGGRPTALSSETAGQVCKYILGLLLETSVTNAILRASQRFNVSKRTIERVWAERLEPRNQAVEPTFPEVLDAVKGFVAEVQSTEPKAHDQPHSNTCSQET
jgi:hypothetical protein